MIKTVGKIQVERGTWVMWLPGLRILNLTRIDNNLIYELLVLTQLDYGSSCTQLLLLQIFKRAMNGQCFG